VKRNQKEFGEKESDDAAEIMTASLIDGFGVSTFAWTRILKELKDRKVGKHM
jgi:hypothetical protein